MKPASRLNLFAVAILLALPATASAESARSLQKEFPRLDVTKSVINLREIQSGGVPRDGIPAILDPQFLPVSEVTGLGDDEPVIFLSGTCGAYAFAHRAFYPGGDLVK